MSADNKISSSRQEKMVADYMGWKVVSGSGARPFMPGDVSNSQWLVECKTHNTEQKNVVFRKTHWNKISKEARSVNKYPVLVTDNGTQDKNATWVMLPKRVINSDNINQILNLVNTSTSGNTITFSNEDALNLFNKYYYPNGINFFVDDFGDESLAILTLQEFKKFYQEQFEC